MQNYNDSFRSKNIQIHKILIIIMITNYLNPDLQLKAVQIFIKSN